MSIIATDNFCPSNDMSVYFDLLHHF